MKNGHATRQANDIKQKRLLGGNPAQKKKKNRFAFFFPNLFFFAIDLVKIKFDLL